MTEIVGRQESSADNLYAAQTCSPTVGSARSHADGASLTAGFCEYLRDLVEDGGPQQSDYHTFTRWVLAFDEAKREGWVSERDQWAVLDAFGDAVSVNTMQGMVLRQPRGYAGDFELMERIYARWESSNSRLVNWDRYLHAQAAPEAVRNRKGYFHNLLDRLPSGACVLDLGSGPGRGVAEWLASNPDADIRIECVDMDANALEYAASLVGTQETRVVFRQANVLRLRLESSYDLIWAGGLFDYFTDKCFVRVASRMLAGVHEGGELVIGNFAEGNPTRQYMELGNWSLYHRSPDGLAALLIASGARPGGVRVAAETEGVNLFVHGSPA